MNTRVRPVAVQPDDTIVNQTSMQRTKSTLTVSRWALLFAAVGTAVAAVSPERAVVDKYCAGCHSSKMKAGGLALDTISAESVSQHNDVWEKVVRKLRARYMPPRTSATLAFAAGVYFGLRMSCAARWPLAIAPWTVPL